VPGDLYLLYTAPGNGKSFGERRADAAKPLGGEASSAGLLHLLKVWVLGVLNEGLNGNIDSSYSCTA